MTTLPLSPSPHDQPPVDGDEPSKWWQTMTKHDVERYALVAASIVIVALTAGAFWLSYAHLAGQHGLGTSPTRRWAWPATLDAFIVAGELLMLRAGLRRVTDKWAIAVTAIGSGGSIALNVAGVSGMGKTSAVPFLDYVVAAVPPAAAMVAFGVLMRHIHQLVEQPAGLREAAPASAPIPPVSAARSAAPAEVLHYGDRPAENPDPDRPADAAPPPGGEATSPAPKPTGALSRRTGRPQDISDDEIRAIAREVMTHTGSASPTEVGDKIRVNRGRKVGNDRVKKVCDELNAMKAEPGNAVAVGSSTG